ncbi:MAG: hypothetical protein ACR2PT_10845, partial [Endozoicomonas sp.]
VERLESHFDSLDSAVRSLITITGETQKILLETRQEMCNRFEQVDRRLDQHDQRFDQHDRRFDQQDRKIDALTEAMLAGFKHADQRADQLELLIRQLLPNH